MPKIYLRKTIGPRSTNAYEVVDGQQRIKAILDFAKGDLVLSKRDNPDLGDTTFDGLPEPLQRRFMQYEISTEVMEEAADPEVWAMFERLNTYTLTLNRQERLNAKFFGYFKQTCYELAAEESALQAWEEMKVFSNRQIARMQEVELTSDVMVAVVEGISDLTEVGRAYKKYDDDFPQRKSASNAFRDSLAFIRAELGETVRRTRFRRKTWFYSLMTAFADAQVRIPRGHGQKRLRSSEDIQQRMFNLSTILAPTPVNLPTILSPLHDSLSRRTSHPGPREIRHDYFYDMLTLSNPTWERKVQETD
jgi:hypothetical protein